MLARSSQGAEAEFGDAPGSAMRKDARVRLARVIGALALLAGVLDFGVRARALPDPVSRASAPWSAPLVAGGAALAGPRLAFTGGGQGAIAWSAAGGARGLALAAPHSANGAPSSVRVLARLGSLALPLDTVTATTVDGIGQVVLAGTAGTGTTTTTAAWEAHPIGPFGAARPVGPGGGPLALTDYLTGEVALAAVVPAGAEEEVVLRLQSPRGAALGPAIALSARPGAVTAVAVGLDWRGDTLVAWQQDGVIYARERATAGALGPLQVLGPSAGGPRLGALISDDGRGIVAWTDETSPTAGEPKTARTRLSISGRRVRFAAPSLVEAWSEPAGLRLGPGAMRLIRLANGRVVLGWTGTQAGAVVARVAPVTLAGLHPAVTVSPPGSNAQLADLASGGRGEVLAVFTATRHGGALDGPADIDAAVGVDKGQGVASFAPPERIAAAASWSEPAAAFEPLGDRPIVAWRSAGPGSGAQVRYAVRTAEPLP